MLHTERGSANNTEHYINFNLVLRNSLPPASVLKTFQWKNM